MASWHTSVTPPLAEEVSPEATARARDESNRPPQGPPQPASRTAPPRAGEQCGVEHIWSWLEDVPDPEIPVLSVNDLGIVRAIDWDGETLVVTVTPTYSGCPATAVIAMSIEAALRQRGIDRIEIKTQLSPPWTTDWIGEGAREKLKAYGIAPPAADARCVGDLKNAPAQCPRCGSMATEQVSRFGSTPCKAAWRCRDCLEPFDYFKSF